MLGCLFLIKEILKTLRAGPGSFIPNPYPNRIDPEHRFEQSFFLLHIGLTL